MLDRKYYHKGDGPMSPLFAVDIPWTQIGWVVVGLLALFTYGFGLLFAKFFKLYIQSRFTCAGICFWHLVFMWVRGVNSRMILKLQVLAVESWLYTAP